MVSTPHGLFVGTANPFAPEVAVERVAGWNYEDNPRGGLEIWLGSHRLDSVAESRSTMTSVSPRIRRYPENRAKEDDEGVLERIVVDYFGGSGFYHFGFWREDIDDARTACENLMDEILTFIPNNNGKVVDVDCGTGASTLHLLKRFPPESVLGIASSK